MPSAVHPSLLISALVQTYTAAAEDADQKMKHSLTCACQRVVQPKHDLPNDPAQKLVDEDPEPKQECFDRIASAGAGAAVVLTRSRVMCGAA